MDHGDTTSHEVLTYSMRLPANPDASALARQAIATRLRGRLERRTLEDVTLAVSELVANAVVHGQGEINMEIRVDRATLKVEVIDQGGGFEYEARDDVRDGVAGRGLFIVSSLAHNWGVHRNASHVWFEIALPNDGNLRSSASATNV